MPKHEEVIAQYARLDSLSDGMTPQERGPALNELVADLLRASGLDAQVSVRGHGEIDVAFSIGPQRFVLEAKWETRPEPTDAIAKLQKRVRQRLAGTLGLFLSMSGYTASALADVKDGDRLEVILLDREHLEAMLSRVIESSDLIGALVDEASYRGHAYTSMAELWTARRLHAPRHDDVEVTSDCDELDVAVVVADFPMGHLGVGLTDDDELECPRFPGHRSCGDDGRREESVCRHPSRLSSAVERSSSHGCVRSRSRRSPRTSGSPSPGCAGGWRRPTSTRGSARG